MMYIRTVVLDPDFEQVWVAIGVEYFLQNRDGGFASAIEFMIDGVPGNTEAFKILTNYPTLEHPKSTVREMTVNCGQVFSLACRDDFDKKKINSALLKIMPLGPLDGEGDYTHKVVRVISKKEKEARKT